MSSLNLIRALDAIVLGLVGLMVLLPQLTVRELLATGRGSVCLVPILLLAYVSFKVPRRYQQIPDWERMSTGLRVLGLIWLGTSPFVVWWLSSGNGFYVTGIYDAGMTGTLRYYFVGNALVSMLAGTAWMMHVNWMVLRLSRVCEAPALEMEAALNRWLLLVGTLCLPLVGMLAMIWGAHPPLDLLTDYRMAYGRLVGVLLLLPMLPVLMVTTLVLRLRYALMDRIRIQFERSELDEQAHAARREEIRDRFADELAGPTGGANPPPSSHP